jgi:oxaloacetate decarboxylase alpha subunit
MSEIRFADTTIRDGQLSLWANNMRTGMMLAVAKDLDQCGFESIETSYNHPKKFVRELKEDPWVCLRLLREQVTETPLRVIGSRFRNFELSPPVLYEILVECLARVGIRQLRLTDEWNQVEQWRRKVALARQVGIDPIINIVFSISKKHTDAYYAERTRQAASLDVYRLCLKDPGGLLTPERIKTLVPIVLENAGDKYVELHSHCTTGLGPINALEAARLGIRTLNTGVPPLANGTALPSLFNVAANLRAMGYTPLFDEAAARRVEATLTTIAAQEGLPAGRPVEYDAGQHVHQVPGGMLTNLRHQLKLVGLEDRYEAAIEECGRVRAEFGYPIMVTPLSQFVGSQAAINVIVGERYKEVTDQSIHYAYGRWGGQEVIDGMDPDVRARILDRKRAKELADWQIPDLTREEARAQFGAPGMSDEEMLLRMEVHESELAVMRAAGPPRQYPSAEQPLVTLIRGLAQRTDRRFIQVRQPGLTITLARHTQPTSDTRAESPGSSSRSRDQVAEG